MSTIKRIEKSNDDRRANGSTSTGTLPLVAVCHLPLC